MTTTREPGQHTAIPLNDAAVSAPAAGAKAARLAELMRAGFDVPPGVAVPADVLERICAPGGEGEMAEVLDAIVDVLGEGAVAVRSSGVAEDLAEASFAGQYETVLDVRGRDAIAAAMRHCHASGRSERVAAYLEERAGIEAASMAVLVQQMVPADSAGVAFSADPVTGTRDRVLVSAVRGLGERLVSGAASPDEWVVEDGKATARTTPEQAIDTEQAIAIADLARRVEAHYGTPQDIEWAIAGGRLYLLQARPITTLPPRQLEPLPIPVDVPEGYWERESTHFPQPLSPMMRSAYLPGQWEASSKVFTDFGLLLEGIKMQEIGGWVYARAVPFGGKEGKPPPDFVFKILARVVPSLRRRLDTCTRAMRDGLAWQYLDRWEREWRPAIIEQNQALRAVDLAALSDAELNTHLERVREHMLHAAQVHFDLGAPYGLGLGDLALGLRKRIGWTDERVISLLSGLSEMSSEPARRLAEVAALAAQRPAVRALLEDPAGLTVETLRNVDPDVAATFERYLDEFGCRALRYEVTDPTLEESPELVFRLLADQLATGYEPDQRAAALAAERDAAAAEARAALAGRPADLAWFEQALDRARRAYPLREENEFYTISVPMALSRYALLELGRRLAERGQIGERDDVMWLEWDEARSALENRRPCLDIVERRQREHAWVLAHPGPATYGPEPGPPPSFAALPAGARLATEILMWEIEHNFPPPITDHAEGALRGIPASAGAYTGPARIVMDESQFDRIRPGDVLVCPITSPVWSVLFASIGALVTESGGVLSHPAIIAREYRVPAVVAVGGATSLLQDGEMVTVDGVSGEVRRLGG